MSQPTEAPRSTRRAHWNNHLERHALSRPDRAAFRFNGETTTWRQLRDRVERLAGALSERGVGAGDRVAVLMGNRPEFMEIVLAANRLGAIGVPVNFRLSGGEVAYILDDSGARSCSSTRSPRRLLATQSGAPPKRSRWSPWVISSGTRPRATRRSSRAAARVSPSTCPRTRPR